MTDREGPRAELREADEPSHAEQMIQWLRGDVRLGGPISLPGAATALREIDRLTAERDALAEQVAQAEQERDEARGEVGKLRAELIQIGRRRAADDDARAELADARRTLDAYEAALRDLEARIPSEVDAREHGGVWAVRAVLIDAVASVRAAVKIASPTAAALNEGDPDA